MFCPFSHQSSGRPSLGVDLDSCRPRKTSRQRAVRSSSQDPDRGQHHCLPTPGVSNASASHSAWLTAWLTAWLMAPRSKCPNLANKAPDTQQPARQNALGRLAHYEVLTDECKTVQVKRQNCPSNLRHDKSSKRLWDGLSIVVAAQSAGPIRD